MKKPCVLIVRDGWGHNPYPEWNHANAVHLAETPVNDALLRDYPWTQIATSGVDVGLPAGVMGNSEVGHQNIGAGRIVDQEVMRITRAIRDGSFIENEVLLRAFRRAQERGTSVHLMGLVSDGRVHSDLDHAVAMIRLAADLEFPADRFFVHAFLDGRDTSPRGGKGYLETLQAALDSAGVGRIASLVGRFYAMDRDFRWQRVQKAYELLIRGSAEVFEDPISAVEDYYENASDGSRQGDEFVTPRSIAAHGQITPEQTIRSGDSVIFFNYRGDRPREISKAFVLTDEQWREIQGGGFDRGKRIDDLYFAGMTRYEASLPMHVVFEKPPKMPDILGQLMADRGLAQFRCAETEKFPHVTFFFNDYREELFEGEDRQIVPSPRDVDTYDLKPEMSARGVTEAMVERIESGRYDLIVLNYANGDMVGHTGSLEAAIQAVEEVDRDVGIVIEATRKMGGSLIVTADHGNCEQMIDPDTGGLHTAHTTYPVDLILVDDRFRGKELRTAGRLADIAPTLLELMGLDKPKSMTGRSLLEL